MKTRNIAVLTALILTSTLSYAIAATPKEAAGFWGTIEGTVKSAKSDGTSFVLTITSAEPDAKKGTVRDGKPMVGKTITLGTRMPKTNGVAGPHPEDIAYIKKLKAGEKIHVKIFAVLSIRNVLRIQAPGEDAK